MSNRMTEECFDLSKYPHAEVSETPSKFWILNLLEIPFIHHGNTFLPVTLCGYVLDGRKHPRGSIWSQPYAALEIPVGPFAPKLRDQIIETFHEYERNHESQLNEATDYALYHLGITDCRVRIRRKIVEYKRSPRNPSVWKVWYLRYTLITHLDSASQANLIDIDGYRGIQFFPISSISAAPEDIADAKQRRTYHGIPLAPSVAVCIDDGSLPALTAAGTVLHPDLAGRRGPGGIFCLDVVRFGKFGQRVSSEHSTLTVTGEELLEAFLIKLHDMFSCSLTNSGFFHWRLEGDGFVATVPDEAGAQSETVFRTHFAGRSLSCLSQLVQSLREATSLATEPLVVRASIHFGEFFYGKTVGAHISGPHLLGRELIKAVRLRDAPPFVLDASANSFCALTVDVKDSAILAKCLVDQNLRFTEEHFDAQVKEFGCAVASFRVEC